MLANNENSHFSLPTSVYNKQKWYITLSFKKEAIKSCGILESKWRPKVCLGAEIRNGGMLTKLELSVEVLSWTSFQKSSPSRYSFIGAYVRIPFQTAALTTTYTNFLVPRLCFTFPWHLSQFMLMDALVMCHAHCWHSIFLHYSVKCPSPVVSVSLGHG